jgi:hypothetical protein
MSPTPTAKLSDLSESLYFDSPDYVTRFDRQTGRIVMVEESTEPGALRR